MTNKSEKLQKLSFSELYDILNFLKEEVVKVDESEKNIVEKRINIVEEELKRIVNNLF